MTEVIIRSVPEGVLRRTTLGSHLRAIRLDRDLTLTQVAHALGVPITEVSARERDKSPVGSWVAEHLGACGASPEHVAAARDLVMVDPGASPNTRFD